MKQRAESYREGKELQKEGFSGRGPAVESSDETTRVNATAQKLKRGTVSSPESVKTTCADRKDTLVEGR